MYTVSLSFKKVNALFTNNTYLTFIISDDKRSFGMLTGASHLSEWETLDRRYYRVKKEKLTKELFDKMEEHYPRFKDNVEYYEVATPKTIKKYIKTPGGTAYGYKKNKFLKNNVALDCLLR